MAERILLKLGGSLITDKTRPNTPRLDVLRRLAAEIEAARQARGDDLQLVIGHGSGSFGHVAAAKYNLTAGATGPESWYGLAQVSAAAARLNRIVMDILLEAGIPAIAFQPSASTRTRGEQLMYFETYSLKEVLKHGLVPVVYGDVSVDAVQGVNIVSTEMLFDNLARELNPDRILLAGDLDGVYTADPKTNPEATLIEEIDSSNWAEVEKVLGGSAGTDVTGGMYTKVRDMYHLTLAMPPMQAMIFSGLTPGNVENALLGRVADFGTLIN
ncbi:MAG: uridylate kinase [Caldilineae bacterium]|nr:MAG: uridylate kinase [Caldilineae bacterium]